jgi:cell division protein FtsQ
MAVYLRMLADLDQGNQKFSEQISEIDLTDAEDARVLMPEQGDDILAHFGEDKFADRYRRYKEHIAEWRKQYPRLASVDLRYEQQVVLQMKNASTVEDGSSDKAAADGAKPAAAQPVALKTMAAKTTDAKVDTKAKPATTSAAKAKPLTSKQKAAREEAAREKALEVKAAQMRAARAKAAAAKQNNNPAATQRDAVGQDKQNRKPSAGQAADANPANRQKLAATRQTEGQGQ